MSINTTSACAVCGKPGTITEYLDTAAAPPHGLSLHHTTDRKRPTRTVCEEHSPYDFGGKKRLARLKAALQQIRTMTFDGNVRTFAEQVLADEF